MEALGWKNNKIKALELSISFNLQLAQRQQQLEKHP
jgi:hypothetical protein